MHRSTKGAASALSIYLCCVVVMLAHYEQILLFLPKESESWVWKYVCIIQMFKCQQLNKMFLNFMSQFNQIK